MRIGRDKIIAALLFTCSTITLSQNLVKNPDFEEYYHLPDLQYEYGEYYRDSAFICKYWHRVKGSTPDYMHINAANDRYKIPYSTSPIIGFNPAIKDSAHIGFVPLALNGCIEPISGEFASALKPGKKYEVSFYYRFTGAPSYIYLDKIECYVSKEIERFKRNFITNTYKGIVTPEIIANVVFVDSIVNDGGWHKITGYYNAIGGEKFMTLGIFYQNEKFYKVFDEYVSSNLDLGFNRKALDAFFKKYRKELLFIHQNPSYYPAKIDITVQVDFDNRNTPTVVQPKCSYYLIDEVSVSETNSNLTY